MNVHVGDVRIVAEIIGENTASRYRVDKLVPAMKWVPVERTDTLADAIKIARQLQPFAREQVVGYFLSTGEFNGNGEKCTEVDASGDGRAK